MTTTTTLPPSIAAKPVFQNETTAGNYFVANYPPFAFWKKEAVEEFHHALERAPRPGVPLGLYTHIPF